METNEKIINLINGLDNMVKDCAGMANSINQLGGLIDANLLKDIAHIYGKIKGLSYKLEDSLESLNYCNTKP